MRHSIPLLAAFISGLIIVPASAADLVKQPSKEELEAGTRLQVFLDQAEFAPGKIDGRYGEFTLRALDLYRQSQGSAPTKSPEAGNEKPVAAPDIAGLDLSSVDPVFIEYTVTEDDLKNVGPVPESVSERARLKSIPYKSAAESVAEKFHTDVDFLTELNPGKTENLKAGDSLSVPNVKPFELATVKDLKPGNETTPQAVNDLEDSEPKEAADEPAVDSREAASKISVKVDTKTNMLSVLDNEKLIAAYPVTIGSEQTVSPVGDWKIRGVARMPNFRYDKAMLEHGERSKDFLMLPPGPNNPVGVIWIALNKKGIGLHGTDDPDSIGRSASHGCVRLANWDVVRLAAKVKTGVPVSIH